MSVAVTMSRTTTVFQNIKRKRRVENKPSSRPKRIAASSYRLDQRVLETFFEFAAQTVDVDFDDVGGAFPVRVPQMLAEHPSRHDLPAVAHEHLQEAELRRREHDLDASPHDTPRGQVQSEVANLKMS